MKLTEIPVTPFGFESNSHTVVQCALPHRPLRLAAVRLRDDHIAAVAAPAVEIPPACGPLPDRRNHFEKVVSDGHQGIFQAEVADAGIDITAIDAEDAGQILHHRFQFPRNQANLAQLDSHCRSSSHVETMRLGGPRATKTRFSVCGKAIDIGRYVFPERVENYRGRDLPVKEPLNKSAPTFIGQAGSQGPVLEG